MLASAAILGAACLLTVHASQSGRAFEFKVLPSTCSWSKYANACKEAGFKPAVIQSPEDKEVLRTLLQSVSQESVWIKAVSRQGCNGSRERTLSDKPILLRLGKGKPLDFVHFKSYGEDTVSVPLCVASIKKDRSGKKAKTDSYIGVPDQTAWDTPPSAPHATDGRRKKQKKQSTGQNVLAPKTRADKLSQSERDDRTVSPIESSWEQDFPWTTEQEDSTAGQYRTGTSSGSSQDSTSTMPGRRLNVIRLDQDTSDEHPIDHHVTPLNSEEKPLSTGPGSTTAHSVKFAHTTMVPVPVMQTTGLGGVHVNTVPVAVEKSVTFTKTTTSGGECLNNSGQSKNNGPSKNSGGQSKNSGQGDLGTPLARIHGRNPPSSKLPDPASQKEKNTVGIKAEMSLTIPDGVVNPLDIFSANQQDTSMDDDNPGRVRGGCCMLV